MPSSSGGDGGSIFRDAGPFDALRDTIAPDMLPPGTDALAGLAVSTSSIALGTVNVGQTSASATVVVTNMGPTTTIYVSPVGVGISVSGCSGPLPSGAMCALAITATPTAVGPIVGTVEISGTPGRGQPVQVSVTGTAVLVGAFAVTPTSIDLGSVVVGALVPVTVTLTSTAELVGLSTGVTGPDLKLDPVRTTCTSALAAGTPCKIAAIFSGATAGVPISDAIVISQGGVTKTVSVTANVLTPAKLAATPTTANLTAMPGGTSANLDIAVGNIGGMSTGPLTVALGGANAADFKIISDKCSIVTLAAGSYCIVTVASAPPPDATSRSTATLTITDKGAGASSTSVALSGGPTGGPALSITGGPSLGSVAPGAIGAEVLFTVTNSSATVATGALTTAISSALVAISSNTCATVTTLNKGDTCTIGLRLSPPLGAAPQAVSALLSVTGANAGKASASVTGSVVAN